MQVQSDWLQDRYDFAAWREIRATEPSLVGIGFAFRGDELAGWRIHRSRVVQVAGTPPAVHSIWSPAGDGSGLIAVDVYESATAEDARAQMLRLLGEFQGTLERAPAVGDVAFHAAPGATLFVRGNYTVLVRSVEREPVAVGDIAQRLDQHLVATPETARDEGGPLRSVTTPTSGAVRPGQRIALNLDVEQPDEGAVWIRFYARSGRIQIEGGRAWYVAGPDGPGDISVVAVDPAGNASRALLRIEKEGG